MKQFARNLVRSLAGAGLLWAATVHAADGVAFLTDIKGEVKVDGAPRPALMSELAKGQKLVLGNQATPLAAVPDPFDPSKVQLGISDSGTVRAMPTELVTGGSLAGLLRFQNDDLTDARNLIGQLASAVAGSLNAQQALGLDLGQPAAAGAPILSVGNPVTRPATGNAMSGGVPVASYVDGSGNRVPSVGLTIVDTRELQPSDYELFADPTLPAGSYRVVLTVDGAEYIKGLKVENDPTLPPGVAPADAELPEPKKRLDEDFFVEE